MKRREVAGIETKYANFCIVILNTALSLKDWVCSSLYKISKQFGQKIEEREELHVEQKQHT